MQITVEAQIKASLAQVWQAWVTPEDIIHWNAASEDWHCPEAQVDLRPGGSFCWRMEARDGKAGFDFAGEYKTIQPHRLIEAEFGGRLLRAEFFDQGDHVTLRETFDAEAEYPLDMQRQGWQAILDRFKAYVEAKSS